MRRRALGLLVLLWLLISIPAHSQAAPAAGRADKAPPAPTVVGGSEGRVAVMGAGSPAGNPGSWYVGATPPNPDPTRPILVFVHGRGGSAQTWWSSTAYHGTNDMYAYAYKNGYRTAFVDLYPEGSMWENGALLSRLLDEIRAHFGRSRVAIVAHSKGGVDTNAASVHYGAAAKISQVVTLGSPHWGTPLADIAHSRWTSWLTELIGQNTEATAVMRTGYMEWFRSITDLKDPTVPYYTLSGTRCGPFLSALWYGCAAISGEDDGVVPVWSARKPGGILLKTAAWDHDEIRMGSRTWSSFAPQLRTAGAGTALASAPTLAAVQPVTLGSTLAAAQLLPTGGGAPGRQALGNLLLRGGEVTGQAAGQSFPLESGVRKVTLLFYASRPDFVATLTGPNGSRHQIRMQGQLPPGDIFGGAWMGSVELKAPAAGSWALDVASAERAGYLMVASLESDLEAVLDRGNGASAPGSKRALAVSFAGKARVKKSRVDVQAGSGGPRPYAETGFTPFAGGHRATLPLPVQAGIHDLSVTVVGTLEDGTPFERSLVSSFAVVEPGTKGPWKDR